MLKQRVCRSHGMGFLVEVGHFQLLRLQHKHCSPSLFPSRHLIAHPAAPSPLPAHLPLGFDSRDLAKEQRGSEIKQLQNTAPTAKLNSREILSNQETPPFEMLEHMCRKWTMTLISPFREILTFFLSSFRSNAHCCLHCSQECGGPYFFSEFVQRWHLFPINAAMMLQYWQGFGFKKEEQPIQQCLLIT